MAQASKHRVAAEAVHARYAAKKTAIEANTDLSVEGRQRQLADAYAAAKRDLAKHEAAERAEVASRKASLEQRFFGARRSVGDDAGSFAISARDASDRAAKIKSPAEALDLLQRADADGDDVLARAVARASEARSNTGLRRQDAQWERVVRAYADNRPHLEPVLDELAELETLGQRELFGPFSLLAPFGIPSQVLNAADPDRRPEPERITDGPLKDPATTTTTAAERVDWYAAMRADA